jgi:hypothetical protein
MAVKGMPLMDDRISRLWPLLLGVILLSAAVISMRTGKAYSRGWAYRAKQPVLFRLVVAGCYPLGILFIAAFLDQSIRFQTERFSA